MEDSTPLDEATLHVTSSPTGLFYLRYAKKKLVELRRRYRGTLVTKWLDVGAVRIQLSYTPERSEIVIEGRAFYYLPDNAYGFLETFLGFKDAPQIGLGDDDKKKVKKWFRTVQPRGLMEGQDPLFGAMIFSISKAFPNGNLQRIAKAKEKRLARRGHFLWCAENYRDDLFHRYLVPADTGILATEGKRFHIVEEWYRRVYPKKVKRELQVWVESIGFLPSETEKRTVDAIDFDYRIGEPKLGFTGEPIPLSEYETQLLKAWDGEARFMQPGVGYDYEGQQFVFTLGDVVGKMPFPVPAEGDGYDTRWFGRVLVPGLIGIQDQYEGPVEIHVSPGFGAAILNEGILGIITDDLCISPLDQSYLLVKKEESVKRDYTSVIGPSEYVSQDNSRGHNRSYTYRHKASMSELVSPHGNGVVLKISYNSGKEDLTREGGCYETGLAVRGCSGSRREDTKNPLKIELWHAPDWVDKERLWFFVEHENRRIQSFYAPDFCFPETPCKREASLKDTFRVNGATVGAERSLSGERYWQFEDPNDPLNWSQFGRFYNHRLPDAGVPQFDFRDVRGGDGSGLSLAWCRYDLKNPQAPALIWRLGGGGNPYRTMPWFDPYHGVSTYHNGGSATIAALGEKDLTVASFTNFAAGPDTGVVPGDDAIAMLGKTSYFDESFFDPQKVSPRDFSFYQFTSQRPAVLAALIRDGDPGLDGHPAPNGDGGYPWFALLEDVAHRETWSNRGTAYLWPIPCGSANLNYKRTLRYWFFLDLLVHDGTFGPQVCSCRWLHERKDKDGKEQLDGLALWAPSPLMNEIYGRLSWGDFADKLKWNVEMFASDADVYAHPVKDDNLGLGKESILDIGKKAEKAIRKAIGRGEVDEDKDIDYHHPLYFKPIIRTTYVLYNNFAPLGLMAILQNPGTHGFIV